MSTPTIAVLALQGAFLEHRQMLARLGAPSFEIRREEDLARHFDALIIPGGESTTQGKLLRDLHLFEPLARRIAGGLPVFGTCAGLLLLAREIENDSRRYFAAMDVTAVRNAYGRQLGSFSTVAPFAGQPIPMTFIRAPFIARVGAGVEVLATVDDKTVAARERNLLVTAFHPELTSDETVHRAFLEMVENARKEG